MAHPLFTEFSDFIGIEYWSKVPLEMEMDLILLIDDPSEYPARFSHIIKLISQSTRFPIDQPCHCVEQ